MKKTIASMAALLGLLLLSAGASAACPAGKQGGGTWCSNGWEWKCEKCGSEYCSIMTGRKCVKDDDADAKAPGQKLINAGYEYAALTMPQKKQAATNR